MAQAFAKAHSQFTGQGDGHYRHKNQQQKKQETHLADLRRLQPFPPEQKQQHRKVRRANEHQYNGDDLSRQAVILADTV